LLAQKRWREAEQSAKAALDLAPNNYIALLRLATAQEKQQEWPSMAKTADIMVTGYPTDATAYVYRARAYAWLNKRDDATASYLAVLSRVPGHLEAKAYLDKK
jgi:tetratricopeptide (TPR) repeat protein